MKKDGSNCLLFSKNKRFFKKNALIFILVIPLYLSIIILCIYAVNDEERLQIENFDEDISQYQNIPDALTSGVSYLLYDHWGGTWSDAEKTSDNTEYDVMCWAAAASNILEWTVWELVQGITDTDEIFNYFQEHWTDEGGRSWHGWQWWFDGTYPSNGWSGWSQVDVPGGDFWTPPYSFSNFRARAREMIEQESPKKH